MNCEVSGQPSRQRLSLRKGSLETTGMGAEWEGKDDEVGHKKCKFCFRRLELEMPLRHREQVSGRHLGA